MSVVPQPYRRAVEVAASETVEQREASRIRAAYALREKTIPKDRYSVFKEENLLANLELQREIVRIFRRFQHARLEEKRVLDVGCGRAFWLRQLIQWGAKPENLFGIDLLEERVREGRELCPPGLTLQCGDAANLEFEDQSFDLILQFAVFTSVLDSEMKSKMAAEMCRVLKPRGAILWYDFHVNNPANPDVRGIKRREIKELFPGCRIHLERLTLAPPLGRPIARASHALYGILSAVPLLCTHYLGLISRQCKRNSATGS